MGPLEFVLKELGSSLRLVETSTVNIYFRKIRGRPIVYLRYKPFLHGKEALAFGTWGARNSSNNNN